MHLHASDCKKISLKTPPSQSSFSVKDTKLGLLLLSQVGKRYATPNMMKTQPHLNIADLLAKQNDILSWLENEPEESHVE